MIDHACAGIAYTEALKQIQLLHFGELVHIGVVSVEHVSANILQIGHILQGVEESLTVAADVRRRAHPVYDERVRTVALGWVKMMLVR